VRRLDVAEDDEMLGDTTWCPLSERARLLGDAHRHAEQISGLKKSYLVNITVEVVYLIQLHDVAVAPKQTRS
jgi:ribulose-bisphosphate carboxylase large chain